MNCTVFEEKVFSACKKIPFGKVSTYKAVAVFIGNANAFRAVGNALNGNRDKKVPCHRIVKSDGKIGGFAFGIRNKIGLLKAEGIEIKGNKINCLEKHLFKF